MSTPPASSAPPLLNHLCLVRPRFDRTFFLVTEHAVLADSSSWKGHGCWKNMDMPEENWQKLRLQRSAGLNKNYPPKNSHVHSCTWDMDNMPFQILHIQLYHVVSKLIHPETAILREIGCYVGEIITNSNLIFCRTPCGSTMPLMKTGLSH